MVGVMRQCFSRVLEGHRRRWLRGGRQQHVAWEQGGAGHERRMACAQVVAVAGRWWAWHVVGVVVVGGDKTFLHPTTNTHTP